MSKLTFMIRVTTNYSIVIKYKFVILCSNSIKYDRQGKACLAYMYLLQLANESLKEELSSYINTEVVHLKSLLTCTSKTTTSDKFIILSFT